MRSPAIFSVYGVAAVVAMASLPALVFSCSPSSTPNGGGSLADAAGDDAESGVETSDANPGRDGGGAAAQDGDCIVQTLKKCPQSDTGGCDSLLTLHNGMEFCTMACASTADCPKGVGVICNTNDGACEPSCTSDTSCKSAGFVRCDTSVGACSTL